MVDAFLLPPSHDLFGRKGLKDSPNCIANPEIDKNAALVESVYATRYKEWWATQFSSVHKADARARAQPQKTKEAVQKKRKSLSVHAGLLIIPVSVIALTYCIYSNPTSLPFVQEILVEFSFCKRSVESLRNELTILENSINSIADCRGIDTRYVQDRIVSVESSAHGLTTAIDEIKDVSKPRPRNLSTAAMGGSGVLPAGDISAKLDKLTSADYDLYTSDHSRMSVVEKFHKSDISDLKEAVNEAVKNWRTQHTYDGVNWLLEVNGATITDHSAPFCPDNIRLCWFWTKWNWNAHLPAQLKADIILQGETTTDSWVDPHSSLGHCWAMNGSKGFVEFRINQLIETEMLILEHATPKILYDGGASAIKDFRIVAWSSESASGSGKKSIELTTGQYLLHPGFDMSMPHIQKFKLAKHKIDSVRLEILTNHGNSRYTCIYKVKLFGTVA